VQCLIFILENAGVSEITRQNRCKLAAVARRYFGKYKGQLGYQIPGGISACRSLVREWVGEVVVTTAIERTLQKVCSAEKRRTPRFQASQRSGPRAPSGREVVHENAQRGSFTVSDFQLWCAAKKLKPNFTNRRDRIN